MATAARAIEPEVTGGLGEKLEVAALDATGGDVVRAIDYMVERVLENEDMLRAHREEMCRIWARQRIGNALQSWRHKIIKYAENPARFADQLAGAMGAEYSRLMDMPLFGGKRLGDATALEIRESANRYASISKDAARKARWQISVADAAEQGGSAELPIKSILSEATLTKLWSDADAH